MEAVVTVLIPVTYFGLMLLERLFPARPLPKVRRWYLTGILFFVVAMVLSALTPALVASAVGQWSPLGLASLGTAAGALVTIAVSEFLQYVLHRTFHNVDFLWRWVHQLHHAAERLDVPGAAFTHPLEVVIGGATATLATMALGVTPDAAALAGFFGVFNAVFQHANIKTPRWLGAIIQRPESHSVHHARGVHAYNYANLPVIDMLFGTYRNPKDFVAIQGFWDGASAKLGALFFGRRVSDSPNERGMDDVSSKPATSSRENPLIASAPGIHFSEIGRNRP